MDRTFMDIVQVVLHADGQEVTPIFKHTNRLKNKVVSKYQFLRIILLLPALPCENEKPTFSVVRMYEFEFHFG